jgi:hypothetical protein
MTGLSSEWISDKYIQTFKEIAEENHCTTLELRRALSGGVCIEEVMLQVEFNRKRWKELETEK